MRKALRWKREKQGSLKENEVLDTTEDEECI